MRGNIVFKYEIKVKRDSSDLVEVPSGSRLLDVGQQQGKLMSWWLIDLNVETKDTYEFVVQGTGWETDIKLFSMQYVKTLLEKYFVWHVFMRPVLNDRI